jgi:hypothetical protein
MTVRNRLAITKKAIQAIKKHSKLDHQLYVYDNQTNHRINEHFEYFGKLYQKGQIAQVTFTTTQSTFNAFSKASTCNFFGLQHEQDPKKGTYDFLVMIDNDIIVTPGWDEKLKRAWKYVIKNKMNNVKVIGQLPGGIKNRDKTQIKIGDMIGRLGALGGSGLWSVKPNFFTEVGLLNLQALVGHDKKHDQQYWNLLSRASKGQRYIMGLKEKLGIHCGRRAGSVCNRLTRNRNNPQKETKILFEEQEQKINGVDFNMFYKSIINDKYLVGDW